MSTEMESGISGLATLPPQGTVLPDDVVIDLVRVVASLPYAQVSGLMDRVQPHVSHLFPQDDA